VNILGYWSLLIANFVINTKEDLFGAEVQKLKHVT
jgi:hypothetical protein